MQIVTCQQLQIGTRHWELPFTSTELDHGLLISNTPWKESRVESRNEAQGTDRTGF